VVGVSDGVAERGRLAQADSGELPWRAWGPYLAERAWGTVREDYSEHGTAWDYFPHDHARSRAYRWNDDGMAGVCDDRQTFCFALALWNGRDPILKERIFGLGGDGGNHGEDAKEYWWYQDSTPTHSWMRWRYHYPQAAFPYDELVAVNGRRSREEPEYELIDTGVFDEDRFWTVTVDYAKAGPTDMGIVVTVSNRGPDEATLHVLPTLWYRNTWSWGLPNRPVPTLTGTPGRITGEHRGLGHLTLDGEGGPPALMCDNETNAQRLWGQPGSSMFPKDGINDHLVTGAPTVNPAGVGTKGALHYALTLKGGETRRIRLRLARTDDPPPAPDLDIERLMAVRETEADAFFAELIPPAASAEEAAVARQGIAGLMWGKQFYHFDVKQWLVGDPGSAPPPPGRRYGRNNAWWHMNSFDVISMPDAWEYPWYAAWDLAFHCVTIARVDPGFAKSQLLLLLREWYMHPNGQIPAYEWAFGDVNPPVHAWAAWRVYKIGVGPDGKRDHKFLARVFQKLLLNFTWWVNRKDAEGKNIFSGGFLGLDNIGVFDRSQPLPTGGRLEQADGTAWMAFYSVTMLSMALELARTEPAYEDMASKFFEHFVGISDAINSLGGTGLWDETDGFYYDQLNLDGNSTPLRVRSMVGLLPLIAVEVLEDEVIDHLPAFKKRMRWFLQNRKDLAGQVSFGTGRHGHALLAIPSRARLERVLRYLLDEG
jgi:hypothetical protein